jgi:putative acetyltransferase
VIATHDFLDQSDLRDICIQVQNDYLPNNSLLVAVNEQDQAIGFMGMNAQEIASLFIDPTYRGNGLGRAFIAKVAAQSPYLKVGVNAQNRQAIAFYKAVGFATHASSPTDDNGRPYPILRMYRTFRGRC